ncbi:MAG: hypothetical protein LBQ60_21390 [Bacteroidales bacterium]|jgi:PKD repeat protein|nr:hypothetical protein [Bacteroidales bacterium]
MKKVCYLLLIVSFFLSCKDEEKNEIPVLSADPVELNFSGEGGRKSFQITSNTNWVIDCSSGWSTSHTEGEGNAEIFVTASENPLTSILTGKITIMAEGLSPVEIQLEQLGSAPSILASPEEINIPAGKRTVEIEVTANIDYEYSVSENWLWVLSLENNLLKIEIDEHTGIGSRTANIILSGEGDVEKVIPVVQEGLSDGIRAVRGNSQIIGMEATEVTILIESSDECDITFNDGLDWLTFSQEKSGREGHLHSFVFDVSEYSASKQRRISVTFTQKTRPDLNVTVDVLQNGSALLPQIILPSIPEGGFEFNIRQWIRINAEVTGAEAGTIEWSLDGYPVSTGNELMHVMSVPGNYMFRITANNEHGENFEDIPIAIHYKTYENNVTRIFDFLPAPGQFTNDLPEWKEGDTQEDMNIKALNAIRNEAVSLGGFGGYVVMGFDHVLLNSKGAYDFRIKGNALSTWSEPGIIMVSYDANANGLPDDEWFEIAGSAYHSSSTIKDYEITYTLAETDPEMLITWTDNRNGSGEIRKNPYHSQGYFPEWLTRKSYTLKGTKLTNENVYDTSGNGSYWVSMPFEYGYVDNCMEIHECSKIKLDWAVDKNGDHVKLKGVDFIRVHTGINALAGWLGEVSTEIYGFEEFNID